MKNNYKNFGIKNSDEYAKLTLVKFALWANISKRYPEFNTMDAKAKVEVFKSSKKPISSKEKSRRIDIAKKHFNAIISCF